MTDIAYSPPKYLPPVTLDRVPAIVAGGALFVGFFVIAGLIDLRQAALFIVGGLLGAALYHGSFGFTGGWRRMVVEKRGRGIRAQMLMIGVAAVAMTRSWTSGTSSSSSMRSPWMLMIFDSTVTMPCLAW